MRAFVFSIIAVSFMMLLILMAAATSRGYAEMERSFIEPQAVGYSSAILDYVGRQFVLILLPEAVIEDGNGSITVRIADRVPRQDVSDALNELRSFIAINLSQLTHANISANTPLVNGSYIEVLAADRFSYKNGINNERKFFFGRVPGSTGVRDYQLNISVEDYRSAEMPFTWDPAGDVNVTVYYTDYNGTDLARGTLRSNSSNHFSLSYGNGSTLDLTVGRINLDGSWCDGAILMNVTNSTEAAFTLAAELPSQPSDSVSLFVFPVQLTYSQDGIYKAANVSR